MAAESSCAVVREGDTVIFDVNGEKRTLIAVDSTRTVKLGKATCSAGPLVGCPYGAMFTLAADGKSLERTEYVPLSDWDVPDAADFNSRSNAELLDGGVGNQALSTADIEAMKAEGKAGADIVAALTANSATFATKTEFSQAKYKKKKAKKYIQVATVRRPTAAAVCEAYFSTSPAKTSYLRVDTLALLLSLANVGAHARVLVVETCGGLVSAAALERLGDGSGGCIVSAWAGGQGAKRPSLELYRLFNFPAQQRAALRFAPLTTLLEEQRQQAAAAAAVARAAAEAQPQEGKDAAEEGERTEALPAVQAEQQAVEQTGQKAVEQNGQTVEGAGAAAAAEVMQVDGAPAAPEQQLQPAPVAAAQQQQQQQQQQQGPFNCCILAANNLDPTALVKHVLPLLAPSASLVMYSPYPQPLADAMDALRGQGQLAGLALHECWWRELQVLPLRSHPTMNMNHGGGFLLAGTVLAPQQQQ